jgi:PAS domain S-box-containing protein
MTSGTTNDIRVLHVDDESALTELVATFLAREEPAITVRTAHSTAEGAEVLADDDIDCVVSDYDMPGQTGLEFLADVRERQPELPFILFTGKGSEEVASEAISAGVTDYLQKERGTSQYAVLANRITNAVEQYRAKRAVAASEKRLSLFIEQSPLGVLEYNEDFEIVRLNERGEEILGYTEAELTGHTWEHLVTENSYDNVDRVTDRLAAATGGYHSIDENVRGDGERIICEWHNRIVTDDDEVVAVFSLFQDITERRTQQQELERYRKIVQAASSTILTVDAAGTIQSANPSVERMFGYDPEALVGESITVLMPDDLAADHTVGLERYLETGERALEWNGVEFEGKRRDGSTFPLSIIFGEGTYEGDRYFVGILRDITDEKTRKQELEETNALLSTLFETLPVGVLAEDASRNILATNRRLFELFELSGSPDERIGDDCERMTEEVSDVFVESEAFVDRTNQLVADQQSVSTEEWALTDGRTYARSHRPIELPDGEGHLWTYYDISERVEQAEELRERERELAAQNDRLEAFASVVSHDLRNPLSVAEGRLGLAREDPDEEHFEAIERAHRRMRALIEDLLTLARADDDGMDREPVALADLVDDCWQTVETDSVRLDNTADRTVSANRSRLRQLVENLLRNSVEHGSTSSRTESGNSVEHGSTDSRPAADDSVEPDAGGQQSGASDTDESEPITVRIGDLEDGFYVGDDGPGIAAADREAVFEAGYSTTPEGTGIGLSIVEQVVETHGWEIDIAEDAAGNVRFEITGVEFVEE